MTQDQPGAQEIDESVVVWSLVGGQSDEQIATRYKLSLTTLRAIEAALITQLKVTDRTELVAALRRALLPSERQRAASSRGR